MQKIYTGRPKSILFILTTVLCFIAQAKAQVIPNIISFSPTSATDQRLVTIKGSHLLGVTAVRFGTTPALAFGVVDDSTVNAIVGMGTSGAVVVYAGAMLDSLNGFTYVPNIPIVKSFTPTNGTQGTVVRITGNHLTSTSSITFGGVPATFIAVHDDMLVSAFVGKGASGFVTVTTSYGKDSLPGFIYQDSTDAPVVQSFSPTTASNGAKIIITGSHFSASTAVSFGGSPAASFSVQADSVIYAFVGNGASGNVQVTTPLGTNSLAGFTYNPLFSILYSFSPDSAATGSTITILGKNLLGVKSVWFGHIPAASFSILNDSVIHATVGAGESGFLRISNGAYIDSLPGFGFIPSTPKMISFSPDYGTTGTVVIIHGFHLSGTTGVNFGGIPATFIAVKDDNTISAFVGAGASGYVSIVTPTGNDSLTGFTYSDSLPKPLIQSFSPDSGSYGSPVTIRGLHLLHANAVSFGGVPAFSFAIQSDTVIIAQPGQGASGDVVVVSPQGTGTRSGFNYINTRPYIYSFSPDSGSTGKNITISGKNLSGVTDVRFGSVAASSFFISNDSTIIAMVGSGESGNVWIASGTAVDSLAGFTYYQNKPTIISFSPKVASTGGLVLIHGINLAGATSVSFGGTAASSFNIKDDNTITAIVAAGSSGTVRINTGTGSDSLSGFIFSTGTVQPNPATNQVTLSFPVAAAVSKVTLTDFQGNQVQFVNVAPNSSSATLNLTGLAKGIYVVSWGNSSGSAQQLLMVQ